MQLSIQHAHMQGPVPRPLMARAAAARNVSVATTSAVQVTQQACQPAVSPLFTPCPLGSRFNLAHRMVYPPLTRMRSDINHVPQSIMAEYYAQRATPGGLMIAEATYTSQLAAGYPCTPGIYNQAQVEAWQPITSAVKARGGVFFVQIWHCGRHSHPELTGGLEPVAPSALALTTNPEEQVYLGGGRLAPFPIPKALDRAGVHEVVEEHRRAARNAVDAGFDGVEVHAASGYLLDQFLKSSSNQRTDEYGGSIENRCRCVLEVVAAVASEIGAERVGIRLSPFSYRLGAADDTPYATFMYLIEQLNKMGLAYVHMVEARANDGNLPIDLDAQGTLEPFRQVWSGTFISAGGYTAESGAAAVASGRTDLVSYGRLWLSNPDLPRRFQLGASLNPYDRNTFYSPGPQGLTDYPFLE